MSAPVHYDPFKDDNNDNVFTDDPGSDTNNDGPMPPSRSTRHTWPPVMPRLALLCNVCSVVLFWE